MDPATRASKPQRQISATGEPRIWLLWIFCRARPTIFFWLVTNDVSGGLSPVNNPSGFMAQIYFRDTGTTIHSSGAWSVTDAATHPEPAPPHPLLWNWAPQTEVYADNSGNWVGNSGDAYMAAHPGETDSIWWVNNGQSAVSPLDGSAQWIGLDEYSGNQDMQDFWASISVTVPTPVPLPGAVWLFGSGLIGLAGLRSRRSSRN